MTNEQLDIEARNLEIYGMQLDRYAQLRAAGHTAIAAHGAARRMIGSFDAKRGNRPAFVVR